jgi:hypothetical protein
MQQIVVAVVLFLRGKKLSLVSDLSVRENKYLIMSCVRKFFNLLEIVFIESFGKLQLYRFLNFIHFVLRGDTNHGGCVIITWH